MNKVTLEAKVGLFFLVTILVFGYVWFRVLDFGEAEGFTIKAQFRSAEGLPKGAAVQIAGIKVGTVKDIRLDPDSGKAVVSMEIREAYRNSIPEDSRVSLKTKGLLGDKFVNIEPGKPNARKLKPGEELNLVFEPTDTEKVFESVGVVAQDLQELARGARQQLVDQKGYQKMDSVLDNSSSAFKNLNDLLVRNKDKIGQTVDSADATFKNLNAIVDRNRDKVNSGVDNLQRFSGEINKTADRFGQSSKDIEVFTKELRSGKGTLGKLVKDEQLYREARGLVQQVRGLAAKIENGPGVTGRLINDPEIYLEARRAIRNMNKTAEDVSEATPVSTLAIILGSIFR
jgi:phospholipid/cholesterol/gamma-HCH transport system substrate-binding protein